MHRSLGIFSIFRAFRQMGALAWGGPTAQLALLRERFVVREQ